MKLSKLYNKIREKRKKRKKEQEDEAVNTAASETNEFGKNNVESADIMPDRGHDQNRGNPNVLGNLDRAF